MEEDVFSHTVVAGTKLYLKFDKAPSSSDVGASTHFFIDDVFIHTGDLEIIEEHNYYPFGLKHKGYNNVVSPNANSVAQKFKYSGTELEKSLGLNLYEMGWRGYDATLGRFMQLDPYAASRYQVDKTPYNFAWNSPIVYSDPLGLCPDCGEMREEGSTTTLENGSTYVVVNGEWERQTVEDLDEVTVAGNSSGSSDSSSNSDSTGMLIPISNGITSTFIYIPWLDGVAIWASGGSDTGTKRRNGQSIKESFDSSDFVTPGGGGAQITRWRHLPNTGDDVVDVIQYLVSLEGQMNNLKDIGIDTNIQEQNERLIEESVILIQYTTGTDTDAYNNITFRGIRDTTYIKIPITTGHTKDSVRAVNESHKGSIEFWLNNN